MLWALAARPHLYWVLQAVLKTTDKVLGMNSSSVDPSPEANALGGLQSPGLAVETLAHSLCPQDQPFSFGPTQRCSCRASSSSPHFQLTTEFLPYQPPLQAWIPQALIGAPAP